MLLVDHSRSERIDNVKSIDDIQNLHYIRWCTEDYEEQYGKEFSAQAEMTYDLVTSRVLPEGIVQRRSQKSREQQTARSKGKAEVFTPAWVCNAQNNLVDEAWFGRKDVFNSPLNPEEEASEIELLLRCRTNPQHISFSGNTPNWKRYVSDYRLEVTCGEAPYLVSRYDAVSNVFIPVQYRIGLLDRKLRVVSENVPDIDPCNNDPLVKRWLRAAYCALMATYGFEWQGDSLFLARKSVLFTFIEHFKQRFPGQQLNARSLEKAAIIISWNLWQMDGLKYCPPDDESILCKIRDWGKFYNKHVMPDGTTYYCELFKDSVAQDEAPPPKKPKAKSKSKKRDSSPSLELVFDQDEVEI